MEKFDAELSRKVFDFRKLGIPNLFSRSTPVHFVPNMVSVILGARRSGKSFRALQVGRDYIKEGFLPSIDHLCHVDFDNQILSQVTASQLGSIEETFLRITPGLTLNSPILFVFDEIHKIKGWEEYVVSLSRNPHWRVIVTGSSARMLRDDLATELRGKAITSEIYPLSFPEYLRFCKHDGDTVSTQGIAIVRRLFDMYLHRGGYPATVGLSEQIGDALLSDYFDTMCLRDIIERRNVCKPAACIHLYRYMISLMSRPFTQVRAFGHLNQSGFPTGRNSVREMIDWAADAWLFFAVPVMSDSVKEQERNYKKLYCIDWGLAHVNSPSWDGSYSRSLENMVYLHLRRRYRRVHHYITATTRREVDFIAVDNQGNPCVQVQVCIDPSDHETLGRELGPMGVTARYFGIKENLLITNSHEGTHETDGIIVRAVPAWKWLLEF